VPYYGWEWPTASDDLNAPVLPLNDRNGLSRQVYYAEALRLAQQWGSTFDEYEGSARIVYRSRACRGCPLVWRQLYFDEPRSLARKYAYVNRRDLRGAGIWALGFEGPHAAELNQLLRDAFPP
jgi:spore germination protein YaaH